MGRLLELTSVAALTLAGWLAGAIARRSVESHVLRARRLDALAGARDEDRVRHPSGAVIELLSEGRGCRLMVSMTLRALPAGVRLDARAVAQGRLPDPVHAAVGLALAREGLLRPELEVSSEVGELRVSQWTEALPTVARMEGLADRVARAVETASRYLEPGPGGAERRRAVVSGLLASDPEIRMISAEQAGGLGVPVLRQLFVDSRIAPELRRRAGRALATRARPGELREAHLRVMREGPDALARFAAAERAAQEGGASLVELLPRARPAAQRVLLAHLTQKGGADAHGALDELLNRGGLGVRMDGRLRRAWRATRRLRDEGRGRLAVLDPDSGALSRPKEPSPTVGSMTTSDERGDF